MNIAVANTRASYYVGGTEAVVLRQSLELARLGHGVVELVRATDSPTENFQEFASTIEAERLPITIEEVAVDVPTGDGVSWTKWYSEGLAFGREAIPSYQRHLREGVDMFASHQFVDSVFMPSQAPSALHLHGNPEETDMLMDSAMAANGDDCVAHSDSIREWWSSKYPNKRYETFRNGVDTDEFYANPAGVRDIDVLYLGRLLDYKGIDDILDSVSPDLKVVIAGSGPFEPWIRQAIADRGLNNVELIIGPNNSVRDELYAKSKIFACPSRGGIEGVLTTMLEAAASGCAILTARGSGMSDLIKDGQNGLLIDPGNTEQMARGIADLLGNDRRRIALATNVQNDVAGSWSWAAKGKELESIYERILSRR